jgi:predicted RNA-binding protein with PIN domain
VKYKIEKMSNKNQNSFIASDRVIRYKLNPKAADILAVLIYKHGYWKGEDELIKKEGREYFFISLNDLIAETRFSKNVIAKNIKLLRQAGLVYSIQQGLGRPNLYSINQEVIDSYIERYRGELKKWQKKIRENPITLSSKGKCINGTSGVTKKSVQEFKKECTTKNKNTKNKKTKNKNFTNQASLADSSEVESKLESLINDLRECHNDPKQGVIMKEIFSVLCQFFKPFENFKMSAEDAEFIYQLGNSEIQIYKIIYKIFENIEHIKEGRKASRFGNLFVGIDKMIDNHNKAVL